MCFNFIDIPVLLECAMHTLDTLFAEVKFASVAVPTTCKCRCTIPRSYLLELY